MPRIDDVLSILAAILIGTILAVFLFGCGSAQGGSGNHAEIIPSPDGSTCYGIFNDSGTIVGGNCK